MAAPLPEAYTAPLSFILVENILLELVGKAEAFGANQTISVSIAPSIAAFATSFALKSSNQQSWRSTVTSALAPLKQSSFLVPRTVNVQILQIQIIFQSDDDIVTKLYVRRTDNQPFQPAERETIGLILGAIQVHVPLQPRATFLADALPQAQKDQLLYQQEVLARLQESSEKIMSTFADFTIHAQQTLQNRQAELEASYQKRHLELETSHQKRQDALEESIRKQDADLKAAYETRQNELTTQMSAREEDVKAREQAVQKQQAELDLRHATAARRANQLQIREIIEAQSKIKLTDDTAKKRRLVHVLCGLGVVAFGALAAVFLVRIVASSGTSIQWQYAIPFSTGLLGFASTLVYWIKWSDDWFREHARAEFANRKFSADATRAAWLVEVLLEWSHEGRETLPPGVVESLTKNLFNENPSESPTHASDVLQKFVSRLASIRIDQKGVELDAASQTRRRGGAGDVSQ